MRQRQVRGICEWLRDARGAVMVEFAIASLVFIMLICGILDLGHGFYIRQVVTNASREGARYGITYRTNSNGQRIAPANLSPSISSYLLNGYLAQTYLPEDANVQITVSGAGYTTGTKGANLEVTVTATKTWFVISNFVPGLADRINVSATTVMQCE